MLKSLFSGVTGLNANVDAMAVVGNNIANVNTVGFKHSRVSFEDILQQSSSGQSIGQTGGGVTLGRISPNFTQGSIQRSENPTDLAISGSGFFIGKKDNEVFYTRAGQFSFDKEGNLVNPRGLKVQGWVADTNGNIATTGTTKDINIGGVVSPPQATSSFVLGANLNGAAKDKENFSTTFTVFDSKGNKIALTLDFTYDNASSKWDWKASSSLGTTTSTGSLSFNANGNLDVTKLGSEPKLDITGLPGGASNLSITWDLLDDTGANRGDITGFSTPSAILFQNQDGNSSGSLNSFSIDPKGVIVGHFTNGQSKSLAQIALADFKNPWSLTMMGENLFVESIDSGSPLIGPADEGSRGTLLSNSLEMSNVDLANEFINMIAAQRGFQANSRVITTSDDILNELVNLKR